jgi:2-polyprenyl-3-methyl-5-hydroxy-6-metoxy-1,4-benzoquinol methylase
MQLNTESSAGWLRRKLRATRLWRKLRDTSFVQSSRYRAKELQNAARESRANSVETVDQELKEQKDPWKYETNPLEQERFAQQAKLLDLARNGRLFPLGLEIGCAEGLFTEAIADRCESLLVLDISPTALARTQARRPWTGSVHFGAFDLLNDAIPGTFDLIVLAGVLEYFYRPSTFSKMREKLAAALSPNGYLLLETTRADSIVEDSWWGKRLIRGKWINDFISRHPSFTIVSSSIGHCFAVTLLQKAQQGRGQ